MGGREIPLPDISIFQNAGGLTLICEIIFRLYRDKALNKINLLKKPLLCQLIPFEFF